MQLILVGFYWLDCVEDFFLLFLQLKNFPYFEILFSITGLSNSVHLENMWLLHYTSSNIESVLCWCAFVCLNLCWISFVANRFFQTVVLDFCAWLDLSLTWVVSYKDPVWQDPMQVGGCSCFVYFPAPYGSCEATIHHLLHWTMR